ncbi:MAG: hypothetical protein JW751_25920 [Polyangiaceae bacterium]|nr:hypothetical protein [Polyangiaceae bacterium]
MVSNRWLKSIVPAFALVAAPLLTNCGGAGSKLPGGGGACKLDLSDPSAIMQGSFGIDAEVEGKVKAALAAGASLKKIAVDVEAEVAGACGKLAMDLGASEADIAPKDEKPGAKAQAACDAAVKLIGEVKAKAAGKLTVKAGAPRCEASIDAMANCAAECDANIEPGSVEAKCEGGEISGKCSGKCEGSCSVEAGAACEGKCSGSCSGSCDVDFSGKCGGKCDGKCDGKDTSGSCAGTCEGKCDASAEGSCGGTCKGTCSASCSVNATGECSGTCSGSCDVKMEAPTCSGTVEPPEMSAECKANCDAKLNAEMKCTPPTVVVVFEGAADAEAATKLKGALEANLPAILKVAVGMKDKLASVTASVKASLEGVQALVKGKGGMDANMMAVIGCVASSLKAQVDAAASINVSVSASASASGSASAG